jgi:carbamate kinase
VEAVIDKDLASAVLARDIGADILMILTDVRKVAVNYRKPDQKYVDRMTASEARRYLEAGQVPAGSMGPKIEAALLFLSSRKEKSLDDFMPAGTRGRGPQRRVVIASLTEAEEALEGKAGTSIFPD